MSKEHSEYIDNVDWMEQPFEWWKENDEPALTVIRISDKQGLNIMAAFADIYDSLRKRDIKNAINSLELVATTFIAMARGKIEQLMDRVIDSMVSNLDDELKELTEEPNGES